MKKLITMSLVVLMALFVSSFTTDYSINNQQRVQCSKGPGPYYVNIIKTVTIDGCQVTLTFNVQFDWDGEGHPIRNVNVSGPNFTVNCGNLTRPADVDLEISDEDAMTQELFIEKTGEPIIDKAIGSPTFISDIIYDINYQVNAQKNS